MTLEMNSNSVLNIGSFLRVFGNELRKLSGTFLRHHQVCNIHHYGATTATKSNQILLAPCNHHLKLSERKLYIDTQETLNPNSIKFCLGRSILKPGISPTDFPTSKSTAVCSLAGQLYNVPGVTGVYIGNDFFTISKSEDIEWNELRSSMKSILNEYFSTNQFVAISQEDKMKDSETHEGGNNLENGNEDAVIVMIKELIATKIRPTVQEDGGDIVYMGFEEGVVKVKLQGSCTSCPSSQVTLKRGVQNMLQFYVPEVMGVIQVEDERDDFSSQEFRKFDESLKDKT